MSRIKAADLKPGMIVSSDVYNFADQLIVPEGSVLTERSIEKIHHYDIPHVRIDDGMPDEPEIARDDFNSSYNSRIRSTPEFKKYKETFDATLETMSSKITDVVLKNAPLDSKQLVEDALSIVQTGSTSINIFDMIHNLRQYDDITFAHSLNVGLICNIFGGWLGLSEDECKLAVEAGILHDIGKLAIPDKIISKPGKLTDEEFKIVKTHPQEGYKILQRYDVAKEVRNAALMHHEKCDSRGYPLGLKAEQIDFFAKMVSIADVYEAMTATRSYRTGICPLHVIELFEDEGLQKYDTRMILTFLEKIVDTYMMNTVELSNGKIGEIVYINKHNLSRPMIKCGNEFVDLSREKDISIVGLV